MCTLPNRACVKEGAKSSLLNFTEMHILKTDSQLQQDVIAELNWESAVHAELIGVGVKDGVVTLASQVDSFPAKYNAERAAQRVSGFKVMVEDRQAVWRAPGLRSVVDNISISY
jgi:osmotically-inducible protein OsmY